MVLQVLFQCITARIRHATHNSRCYRQQL
jgi:hypothetical protein